MFVFCFGKKSAEKPPRATLVSTLRRRSGRGSISNASAESSSSGAGTEDAQARAIRRTLEDDATEAPPQHRRTDGILTHEYLRRVLEILREKRSKIEAQGRHLSSDDITPELSRESVAAPTVTLAVVDAVLFSLLQQPALRTSPRKISLSQLAKMKDGELLLWSEQLVQSLQPS